MKNLISTIIISALFSQVTNAALLKSSTKKGFNPDIGLNALFEYTNSTDSSDDGFSLSEIEMQFSSDIDAYFRGEATVAIHKEHAEEEEGTETDEHSSHASFAIEPEEVFIETISIPSLTFKFGKFYADAGKFNTTHSHARMFTSRSRLENEIFGDEGLSQVGVSASYLLPVSIFSELTVGTFTPDNEEAFGESTSHDLAYNAKFKSLIEVNDSSAIDFGLTYVQTKNKDTSDKTTIYGADLSYRFTSINSSSKSHFSLVNEYLKKKMDESNTEVDGISSGLKYQSSARTFIQYRYETMGVSSNSSETGSINTVLFAFIPSEFSSIRVQYDDFRYSDEKKLTLQLNFSMGAHPAHAY